MSGARLVVSAPPGQLAVARFDEEGRPDRLAIRPILGRHLAGQLALSQRAVEEASQTGGAERLVRGDIILTRIVQILKGGQGALVALPAGAGPSETGLLGLKGSLMTLGAKGRLETAKLRPATDVTEGQAVLAQVTRAAMPGGTGGPAKGPRLSGAIALAGRLCVFHPFGEWRGEKAAPAVQLSRHWSRAEGQALRERLAPALQGCATLTVRTAARAVSPEAVAGELAHLQADWNEGLGSQPSLPAVVWRSGTWLIRRLRDWLPEEGGRLTVDDRRVAEGLERLFQAYGLTAKCPLETLSRPGCAGAAFDAFDLEDHFSSILSPRVPLPGGASLAASLVIERTEALTAIDINAGGASNPLQVNRDAMAELARQIDLRDLGGLLVIDLIGEPDHGEAQRLGALLEKALQSRSSGEGALRVAPPAPFGTLMVTRERSGEGPFDEAGLTWGAREAAGLKALGLLRALGRPGPQGRPGPRKARVGAGLADWVKAQEAFVREALADASLAPADIVMDRDLAALEFILED